MIRSFHRIHPDTRELMSDVMGVAALVLILGVAMLTPGLV